ncbi:MAG: AEC family transporter [Candidatus Competibacterales bacterium]
MIAILQQVAPFFALIVLGVIAERGRWLGREGIAALNRFVFYLALPALLLRAFGTKPPQEVFNLPFMGAYALAGLGVFALTTAAARSLGHSYTAAAFQGQAAVTPNNGFLALPLLVGLLGEAVALPVGLALVVDLTLVVVVTLTVVAFDRGGGLATNLYRAGSGLVTHPVVVAIAVGLGWSLLQLPMPLWLDHFTGLLAPAAAPVALFALGATLGARAGLGDFWGALGISGLKLLVHPLAIAIALWALLPDLESLWYRATVMVGAMPVAANVYLFAAQYDAKPQLIAAAITVSTAASLVTITALAGWLLP